MKYGLIALAAVILVGGGVGAAVWFRSSSAQAQYRDDAERLYLILDRASKDLGDELAFQRDYVEADTAWAQLRLHFPDPEKAHVSARELWATMSDLSAAANSTNTAKLNRQNADFLRSHDTGDVGVLTRLTGASVSKKEWEARDEDKHAEENQRDADRAKNAVKSALRRIPALIRDGN